MYKILCVVEFVVIAALVIFIFIDKNDFAADKNGFANGIDANSSVKSGGGGMVGRKSADGDGNDDFLGGLMCVRGGSLDYNKHVKVSSPDSAKKGGTLLGGRSRASVQRVVMQNIPALRYAYNKRLIDKPWLAGMITVKFAIDESGTVIFTQVVESTMDDSNLERTVADKVKSWNFDGIDKPGDVTEVVYPFSFSP